MRSMTPQEVREKVLELLYQQRSLDFTEPKELMENIKVSDEGLDAEIRYLAEKNLLKIMGAFMGQKYLNFVGIKITSHGADIIEKAKEMSTQAKNPSNSLEDKTDEELEAIIRQAINPHIPGSLHQRAQIELDIRHRKKMEQQSAQKNNEVSIVAGTLNNNGIIGSHIEKSPIGSAPKENFLSKLVWQFVVVIIAAVIAALILAYFFGIGTR